jgi:hypothetical protein
MVVPSESPRPWGTIYHAPPNKGDAASGHKVHPTWGVVMHYTDSDLVRRILNEPVPQDILDEAARACGWPHADAHPFHVALFVLRREDARPNKGRA